MSHVHVYRILYNMPLATVEMVYVTLGLGIICISAPLIRFTLFMKA